MTSPIQHRPSNTDNSGCLQIVAFVLVVLSVLVFIFWDQLKLKATSVFISEGKLVSDLIDSDPTKRLNAALALADKENLEALDTLLLFLNDPDPDTRVKCIHALSSLSDESAVGPICNRLMTDPESHVRAQSILALGDLGGMNAAACLLKAARGNEIKTRPYTENKYYAKAVGNIDRDLIIPPSIEMIEKKVNSWLATEMLIAAGLQGVDALVSAWNKNNINISNSNIQSSLINIAQKHSVTFFDNALLNQDLQLIADYYPYFVYKYEYQPAYSEKYPALEPTLIATLNKHGSKSMAESFLNNPDLLSNQLAEEAEKWAKSHGYFVKTKRR